jgi:hypothetical protein
MIEWKRGKEGKTEVADNNDTIEVVKSIVSIEVVESSETGCAVEHCSASHRRSRQHWSAVDRRPSHKSAMSRHLCSRCRGRENA